ncbi:PTS system mannose/fructose/sorbose family transporter subunit IID [Weissella paramesenteroides]|uniref:PTS system mannose/fructose/sorbose family IID component n=1 Tax=Weissella paramesenteroides ATCC 33313 TaxID=585506 RepID=C5R8Q9_WEIPA|nr:PTS system mannose/fructose/sorbose family transporter subunit IID [Weissella paramesenteroides]ATF40659.1 PTS fructose transporter subunit IID [Weissella paramesenteroides]EER75553.1 PTS system mannose/fructose/sorbose family IID component [Weissella paramesenteroides ATCC 33313]
MVEQKKETILTNKELNQIWRRWGFTHLSSMSYEKIQGHSWAYAYLPFARKHYKDEPEKKRRLLMCHSMFYNTEPQTGQLINGIVASLEEQIAMGEEVSEEMPVNIKTTLMGPLAGIGDSIIQGIIVPILLSIAMSLAAGGSVFGPIFYILAYGVVGVSISYIAFRSGYRLGVSAIDTIVGENSKRITDAFNILGVMVVGALAANTIVLKTTAHIPMGGKTASLESVLNGIFPGLLPLGMVMLGWWLVSSKQMSATKVILIMVVIITIGCLIGLF